MLRALSFPTPPPAVRGVNIECTKGVFYKRGVVKKGLYKKGDVQKFVGNAGGPIGKLWAWGCSGLEGKN